MKEQEAYFDLIAARQSCRRFDPSRPVEREKLDRCLEAARLAPSACNSQPWRFHVATGEALCGKLRPCVQRLGMNRFADDCPAFIVVTEARAALKPLIAAHLSEREFSSVDIGIATAHLCLAATAQGLSTCIIGWLDGKKSARRSTCRRRRACGSSSRSGMRRRTIRCARSSASRAKRL